MNKLKVGTKIFGWFFILHSVISFVFVLVGLSIYNIMDATEKVPFNMFIILCCVQFLYVILLSTLGVSVLKLKRWAPSMAIIIAIFFLVLNTSLVLINIYLKSPTRDIFRGIFLILVSILTIYFFTRPGVKAQFK